VLCRPNAAARGAAEVLDDAHMSDASERREEGERRNEARERR
jgi:hypothetical protein